uniref:CKLF factor n=1 Tax=Cyanistes caeruleus TaxID=156563 RepID=A0A8C0U911_CYACU
SPNVQPGLRHCQGSRGSPSCSGHPVPGPDIFNSMIAALFLLVVSLFAIIIKTNKGTLAGGVLGLILLVLCLADAILLFKTISRDKSRGRSAPAK